MKKYLVFFILIYFAILPTAKALGYTTTTGFIPGQIWYSKDSFVEGETVKIYTALWNNSTSPLSAKVEFYDKNVILGSRDVVIPSSKLEEISVSWKVTSGDHSISAKIISPSVTLSGKKESVTVSNSVTGVDKRYIPVVINTVQGTPATSTDIIKSQVDKAASSIGDIVPDSISSTTGESIGAIDNFRADTLKSITDNKTKTEKEIEELNKSTDTSKTSNVTKTDTTKKVVDSTNTVDKKVPIQDATEKPIAYLKLFFLSILSFIFGSKLVFYSLALILCFFILRFIYRKIRNI